MNPSKMKPIRIFTAVWGSQHIEWLQAALIRSLQWPRNAQSLEGAMWSIVTQQSDKAQIERIIQASGLKVRGMEFMILPEPMNPHASGQLMKEAFVLELSKCITFGAQLLIAPPDTLFGDGSVEHLRIIGSRRDVVVFAAHMRVLPGVLDNLTGPLSNSQLVSLAMRNLHKTWMDSQLGLEQINTYVGGVLWEYLDENLYSCQHFLPTPYLINPTPEDLVYFKNQIHFGVIDHDWPGECLIETQRQRLVGSSDGAFMVEITPAEANIPPVAPYREDEPDLFWRRKPHNQVNKMTSIILRGE